MELSLRLASCEMKSMPSLLMAPHVLIAMMTRRMLGIVHSQHTNTQTVAHHCSSQSCQSIFRSKSRLV